LVKAVILLILLLPPTCFINKYCRQCVGRDVQLDFCAFSYEWRGNERRLSLTLWCFVWMCVLNVFRLLMNFPPESFAKWARDSPIKTVPTCPCLKMVTQMMLSSKRFLISEHLTCMFYLFRYCYSFGATGCKLLVFPVRYRCLCLWFLNLTNLGPYITYIENNLNKETVFRKGCMYDFRCV